MYFDGCFNILRRGRKTVIAETAENLVINRLLCPATTRFGSALGAFFGGFAWLGIVNYYNKPARAVYLTAL